MSIIKAGEVVELLVFILTAVTSLYYLLRATQGKTQELRKMSQVDAISDVVDKAVEEGKPIYISPGDQAYLSGMYANMTITGMNVLRYTTRLAIQRGARVVYPIPVNPESLPLIDGIFKEVAVAEGKPETYRRQDLMYYGSEYNSYTTGFTATIAREGASGLVEVGAITGGGSSTPAGWVREFGGTVVGGTARYNHQGTWAMLADYPLFMDDIFAVGAICSGDDTVKASIVGGDVVKLVLFAVTLVFSILALLGQPAVSWLKI
ncbi:hypothetical protein MUP00_04100 [Candidatus Bathyarchaeota archaeon]|jgi:hypothetical protein|nr:hypothetical protein [Candidatus Bathyarchaeota archaeon]